MIRHLRCTWLEAPHGVLVTRSAYRCMASDVSRAMSRNSRRRATSRTRDRPGADESPRAGIALQHQAARGIAHPARVRTKEAGCSRTHARLAGRARGDRESCSAPRTEDEAFTALELAIKPGMTMISCVSLRMCAGARGGGRRARRPGLEAVARSGALERWRTALSGSAVARGQSEAFMGPPRALAATCAASCFAPGARSSASIRGGRSAVIVEAGRSLQALPRAPAHRVPARRMTGDAR